MEVMKTILKKATAVLETSIEKIKVVLLESLLLYCVPTDEFIQRITASVC